LSSPSSSFHLQSSQSFVAIVVLIIFIIVAVVQLTIHNATINSQMPAVYAERPVSLQRKHAGTLIDWCVGQYSWNGCWFSCIIRLLVVACIPTPSSLYLSPFVSIWDDYKVNRCGDGDSNCGIKVDDISGDEDMTTIQLLHRQSSAVTTIRRRFDWIVNEQRDCRG